MTVAGAFLLILLSLSQRHGDFMWLHLRTSAHDQDGNHNLISLRAPGGPRLPASRLGHHPAAQPALTGLRCSFRLKNRGRNAEILEGCPLPPLPVSLPTQLQGRPLRKCNVPPSLRWLGLGGGRCGAVQSVRPAHRAELQRCLTAAAPGRSRHPHPTFFLGRLCLSEPPANAQPEPPRS